MHAEIITRCAHFLGIIALGGALPGQLLLVRIAMTRAEIEKLSQFDKIYAVAVIVVLGAGFHLWFGTGKPAEFYSENPVFKVKLILFLIIGLLSIYPTIFFNRERKGKGIDEVFVPRAVRWSLRGEFLLVLFMPLLASLMARGIGHS